MESYDVLIIGAGPAGLCAAIYTARAGLKTAVIGDSTKSQLAKAHAVENYFGILSESGSKILETGVAQVQKFNGNMLVDEVVSIKKENEGFILHTANDASYSAKVILIATGMAYQMGGIKGEEALTGKGVHYCVLCDGYFYKGKNVAVIGRQNYAAEEALELLQYTKNITIFSNGKEFEIAPALLKKLEEAGVKLRTDAIGMFSGENMFDKLVLEDGKQEDFDGVFMAVGTAGAISFAKNLGIEADRKAIKVDADMKTSVKGIYAAGACVGGHPQLAKEVGDGCIAGISIIKEIGSKRVYIDYG